MILLADSGGSKTDWRLISEKGEILQFKTAGLNPYIVKQNEIEKEISVLKKKLEAEKIDSIFFYGAGCSSKENIGLIEEVLMKCFEGASVEVNHDLLAAARATCDNKPGVVCILGTGANSCLYNGAEIIENIPSLGFILGDEGGGSYLGKLLLNNYFKETLPDDLSLTMEKRYTMNRNDILENIYKKPQAAQYLASFAKFLFDHKSHPYIYQLIYDSFKLFYQGNVLKYKGAKDYPVHFVGSIAFYFNSLIRQVGSDLGLTVRNILESPISGLTLFHQKR